MANYKRVFSDLPIPPGYFLKDVIEDLGWTQAELARRMSRPEQTISEIIHGRKAITTETALQLEEATEVPAHIWLGLESTYRLTLARAARKKVS